MPLLRIPDETGDTRIPWVTDEEQAAAAFQFDQFSRQGYAAFAEGRIIKEFDPAAAEITMLKPIAAG
jgi:hypothetical protein